MEPRRLCSIFALSLLLQRRNEARERNTHEDKTSKELAAAECPRRTLEFVFFPLLQFSVLTMERTQLHLLSIILILFLLSAPSCPFTTSIVWKRKYLAFPSRSSSSPTAVFSDPGDAPSDTGGDLFEEAMVIEDPFSEGSTDVLCEARDALLKVNQHVFSSVVISFNEQFKSEFSTNTNTKPQQTLT